MQFLFYRVFFKINTWNIFWPSQEECHCTKINGWNFRKDLWPNKGKKTKMASKCREECNQSRLQNLTRGWFLLILIRMWVCKRLFPQVDLGQPPVRPISTDRTPLDPLPLGGLPHQCGRTLETRTRTGEVSVQKVQSRTFPRSPLLQASRTGQTLEANPQVSLLRLIFTNNIVVHLKCICIVLIK